MATPSRLLSHPLVRFALEESPIATLVLDVDGSIVDGNALGTGLLRDRASDVIGSELAVWTADVPAARRQAVTASNGYSSTLRSSFVSTSGIRDPWAVRLVPVTDSFAVIGVIGFLTPEWNPRRSIPAVPRKSDQLAVFGLWSISVPAHALRWSDTVGDMLGHSADGSASIDAALSLYPTADLASVSAALVECEANGTPFDIRHRVASATGELLWVRSIGEAERDCAGVIVGVRGAMYDRTHDVRAGQEQRAAERRLESTMNAISEGIVIVDSNWTLEYVNSEAERILSRSTSRLLGMSMWDAFPDSRGTEFSIAYRRALIHQRSETVREFYEPLQKWIVATARPIDGGLGIYFRDVTDEEHARTKSDVDDRTIVSQAALLDIARDAIIVRSLDHIVGYWNRAATETYGWTEAEALGTSIRDLLYADSDEFDTAVESTLRDGYWSGEIEQLTKSGNRIIADSSWTLVRDASGEPQSVFSVNTDITDRKRREEVHLRTQRMESLGTLAGGVAHDLNNVLTPILMAAQVLARTEQNPARSELLRTVESSVARGADMIKQVLSFARGVEGRRIDVDTGALLAELVVFARDALIGNVEIETAIDEHLLWARGDPTQLLQALVNLVANANDAMPYGGTLTIAARNLSIAATSALRADSLAPPPGDYIVIEITDTGDGMSAEVVSRVFEPFFTTKPLGEGTGLGLATTTAILRSHRATISVRSELGTGSVFTIHLPATRAAAKSAVHDDLDPVAELVRGTGQRILVVDDEPATRRLLSATLESFGYLTAVASNGIEALEIADETHVDLVITDVIMPTMDGAATVRELAMQHPTLPVIVASGLGADAAPADRPFLAKPFTTEQLLTTVAMALAGSS